MIKKILKLSFIAAVAVAAGYTAYSQSQKTVGLSDLALENVEALAYCEWTNWVGTPEYHITLTGYCSWNCSKGGSFQCPI